VDRAGVQRALGSAALAVALDAALAARPPGGAARWERTNHRGRQVSLLAGPALVVAGAAGAGFPRASAAVGGLGAGAVGVFDDVAGARHPGAKGFRGHLAALRRGRLTSGMVKVAGIGAAGVASAALLQGRRPAVDVLVDGAVVAGAANLLNLFDLRPGRALKVGIGAALLLGQPGPAGAAAALLPADLHERSMLGDGGANGLGALLGLAFVHRHPQRPPRLAALAGLVGLTAASEVVSFSRVIDAVPALRWADGLGRLPRPTTNGQDGG
jgi:UDP-GlcNAc:undecaprenyl-phosphate GlcNAc-1-phosphate transferase